MAKPSKIGKTLVGGLTGGGGEFGDKTRRKMRDPAGLWKDKPKAPEKTGEELAIERRNRSLLDKEIEEEETRLKAGARGQRGMNSLLGKAARNRKDSASNKKSASTASHVNPGKGNTYRAGSATNSYSR